MEWRFSDNDCQEEPLAVATVSNPQDESFASISLIDPTVLPVSIASPTEVSPRVSLLNIDDYQTNKETNPCDAITQDFYMPTDAMAPVSAIEFPQSVNSHQHHDLDVTMPLTPILNELPMQSIDKSPIEITPVASPVNRHAKCDMPCVLLPTWNWWVCLSICKYYRHRLQSIISNANCVDQEQGKETTSKTRRLEWCKKKKPYEPRQNILLKERAYCWS